MKRVLTGLFILGSVQAYADCSINVDVMAPDDESHKFNQRIEKILHKKGFNPIAYSYNGRGRTLPNAEYSLSLVRDGWGHHILDLKNKDGTIKESMLTANVFSMKRKLINLVRKMETKCNQH